MTSNSVTFVYPGDLNTRTGGYRYDKSITETLSQGSDRWVVSLLSLEGDYPFPTDSQLYSADEKFSSLEDGALTVVDGLAYSVMPELMAKHATRLRLVALVHHPLALETGLSEEQAVQMRELETRALHYARRVITTSELTASSLDQYNVPGRIIVAVLPGTESASIANGSASDTRNLLCVATLTPRKGHGVLLDALKKVESLPWHLTCVGSTERDKPCFQELLAQRDRYAFIDRVSFLGELSDEDVDRHYCRADVFVLASFHEGYGMVLSEAIAHGLPVICSDAGAISQTVPKGTGILVPPGDPTALAEALNSFLTDKELRVQMKKAALTARQHLRSWRTAADEFSQILKQVSLEPPPKRNYYE